jgi:hypothetical protein
LIEFEAENENKMPYSLAGLRLKLKKTHQNECQNKPISHHITHSRVEQEKTNKMLM